MNRTDLKVETYDIETLAGCFLYCAYIPHLDKKVSFEVSFRKNEIDALVKHLIESGHIGVGFYSLMFDAQVIQYILDNHDKWYDLSNQEVVDKIYAFAQEVISLTKYELQPPYKESFLDIEQIDLFKIHHMDNKARRCSLKWLEFSMNMPDIEEMPIPHTQKVFTEKELDAIVSYCWNDIEATYRFWKITIGETDNELYKDSDKIQDRLDIIEELQFPKRTINYADVKIGDEINKAGYMKETGCTYSQIYDKKKQRKPTPKFTFGDCIPKYIKFKTPEFNAFYDHVKKQPFKVLSKPPQEYVLTYGKTTYSVMKGGIHSHDGPRILEADNGHYLRDADIGSQYPNAITKRKLYPAHLGPKWNVNYEKNIHVRMDYKAKGKTSKKFKGLANTWKLCLNGGGFGMTNQADNWQYDPMVTFKCTIGNQFEILMLIEMLELEGISVMSANTDGIVCLIPITLDEKYYEICHEWEHIVGNDQMGQLEYMDYKKLIQTSVNDYLAIPVEGKIKTKGDFCVDIELHKNKSRRIVPIALTEYFVNNISVRDTVMNHRDIYDFCCGAKSSSDYFYEGVDRKTGKTNKYNKLLRYYISNSGEKLYKVKHEDSEKKGRPRSQLEANYDNQIVFNRAWFPDNWDDYDICYEYYIAQCNKIIYQVLPEVGRSEKITAKRQIEMF